MEMLILVGLININGNLGIIANIKILPDIGRNYHFVTGCRFRERALSLLRRGWKLQAPSLLLHRTTLVALHAINLLLHAHLCLHLIGKHSTLWPILGGKHSILVVTNSSGIFITGKLSCPEIRFWKGICPDCKRADFCEFDS